MTNNTTTEINWKAVDRVAARLGAHTRALVAAGDTEEAIDWALKMASQYGTGNEANWPCAATYLELAALLDPRAVDDDEPELDDEPPDDQEEDGDDDA